MKALSNNINISNHPEYGFERKVTGFIVELNQDINLILEVSSYNEGVKIEELTTNFNLTASSDPTYVPRKNPSTGEDVFYYEITPGASYEYTSKGNFHVVNGDFVLVDGEKVINPLWDTAIPVATFFYNMTIAAIKQVGNLTDSNTFQDMIESQIAIIVANADSRKRFDV